MGAERLESCVMVANPLSLGCDIMRMGPGPEESEELDEMLGTGDSGFFGTGLRGGERSNGETVCWGDAISVVSGVNGGSDNSVLKFESMLSCGDSGGVIRILRDSLRMFDTVAMGKEKECGKRSGPCSVPDYMRVANTRRAARITVTVRYGVRWLQHRNPRSETSAVTVKTV